MEVFAIKFNGHYPVGASAVVTATSERAARDVLMGELKLLGLADKNKKSDLDVTRIVTTRQACVIVQNGDY